MTNPHDKMHTILRYKWKDHDGVTWEAMQPASWVAEFSRTHAVYDIRTVPNTGGCDDPKCWCNFTGCTHCGKDETHPEEGYCVPCFETERDEPTPPQDPAGVWHHPYN
jgi:hypothetical protein